MQNEPRCKVLQAILQGKLLEKTVLDEDGAFCVLKSFNYSVTPSINQEFMIVRMMSKIWNRYGMEPSYNCAEFSTQLCGKAAESVPAFSRRHQK